MNRTAGVYLGEVLEERRGGDNGGGEIFENEIFTVEPGLYSATLGGVRVEDMVLVTAGGHEILSPLHEGLSWKD